MPARHHLSASLILLALAPLAAADKDRSPGNPPVVLLAEGIDADGNLVLVHYRTIFIQPTLQGGGGPLYNDRWTTKVSLKGATISGTDGKELTVEAARKKLGTKEAPVLASAWGEPFPPAYRSVFKDDAVFFAFPKDAPKWENIQAPDRPVGK